MNVSTFTFSFAKYGRSALIQGLCSEAIAHGKEDAGQPRRFGGAEEYTEKADFHSMRSNFMRSPLDLELLSCACV